MANCPKPFDYSGFTAAQRRAAYLGSHVPGGRPRNPLTGHFTGGDGGDRRTPAWNLSPDCSSSPGCGRRVVVIGGGKR